MNEEFACSEKKLRFFNDAIEYFDDNSEISINSQVEEEISQNPQSNNSTTLLRDEMLTELNNLKEIIVNFSDSKINALEEDEKELFYDFVKFYSICPVCGNFNHYYNLKKVFFDPTQTHLIQYLIDYMNHHPQNTYVKNINIGIPCCKCYKTLFPTEE